MSENKDIKPGTIGRVMFDTVTVPSVCSKVFTLGNLKVVNKEEYISAVKRFAESRQSNNQSIYGQVTNSGEHPVGMESLGIDPSKVAFRIDGIYTDPVQGVIATCVSMDTPAGKLLQQQIEMGSSSFGIRALRDNDGKLAVMSFDLVDAFGVTPAVKPTPPKYRLYMTARGQPTVYVSEPSNKPVLTVANYCKWYELYLVNPDGSVTEVDSSVIHEVCDKIDGASWVDHIYSPQLFYGIAELLGAYYCSESAEVIVGRWMLENRSLCEVAEEHKLFAQNDTGE